MLFEGLNFKIVAYFPDFEDCAAGTLENSSVKTLHGFLEIDFLHIRRGTLKSYSFLIAFDTLGLKFLKNFDSRRK